MSRLVKLTATVFLLSMSTLFAGDAFMGNYEGEYKTEAYDVGAIYAQVIAQGNGSYRAVFRVGFNGKDAPGGSLVGNKEGNKVVFDGTIDVGYDLGGTYDVKGEIVDSKFSGHFSGSEASGNITMNKVEKKSPTLGAKAPQGAIVLFDGKDLNHWKGVKGGKAKWKLVKGGAMQVTKGSIISKEKFGDCKIHVEFRTPFMPKARGQKRGNSGVYVQGRYEVQVLDSFGLEGKDNECGGIYKIAAPKVNACLPPLQWQTYDIVFHAPKFDNTGHKIKNAVITVKHNGILIHEQTEIPKSTGGAINKDESKPGGLMLQDHHNPVQYRNIWVLPL